MQENHHFIPKTSTLQHSIMVCPLTPISRSPQNATHTYSSSSSPGIASHTSRYAKVGIRRREERKQEDTMYIVLGDISATPKAKDDAPLGRYKSRYSFHSWLIKPSIQNTYSYDEPLYPNTPQVLQIIPWALVGQANYFSECPSLRSISKTICRP